MLRGRNQRATHVLAGIMLLGAAWIAAACGSRSGVLVPPTCASYAAGAELSPLDVFIALDISGSMGAVLANGKSKFQAISDALDEFLHDADSTGIGVTIAFFPQIHEGVPEHCKIDGECGSSQACLKVSACLSSSEEHCHTAADCATPGDSCEPLGTCTDDPKHLCFVNGNVGCATGTCVHFGICPNRSSCDVKRYEPALAVQELPGAANAVVAEVAQQIPGGGTPTLPALAGSLSAASAFAQTHTDHRVIVLLATDGLPTDCDPAVDPVVTDPASGIPKLVSAAQAAAKDGIGTFVIGVFTPEEAADAQENLGQIAQAGSGNDAFIVSTSGDLEKSFLETLTKIRRAAKACEFSMPTPNDTPLDAARVVVHIDAPGGKDVEVQRRNSAADCDTLSGGFYYERDPFGPIPPGRITLCPASCSLTDQGTRPVNLEIDCNQSRWIYP